MQALLCTALQKPAAACVCGTPTHMQAGYVSLSGITDVYQGSNPQKIMLQAGKITTEPPVRALHFFRVLSLCTQCSYRPSLLTHICTVGAKILSRRSSKSLTPKG